LRNQIVSSNLKLTLNIHIGNHTKWTSAAQIDAAAVAAAAAIADVLLLLLLPPLVLMQVLLLYLCRPFVSQTCYVAFQFSRLQSITYAHATAATF
jgi:hypothetical protein